MTRLLALPIAILSGTIAAGLFAMNRETEPPVDPIQESGAAHLKWLKPSFLVPPWRLETLERVYMGREGITPRRLLAKRGSLTIDVTSLNELQGKVRLETCADALTYVRLQTSPTTYWAFPKPMAEIMPFESVRKSGLFGDEPLAKWLRELRQEGYYGFVEAATMKRLDIAKTSCEHGEGFVITRTLAPRDTNASLVKVREEVTSDGGYRWTVLEKKPRGDVTWFMPDPSSSCPIGMSCC